MGGLIDIHQHIIRAIDNEPPDWNEVTRMLEASVSDGIQTVIATPHVMPGVVPFEWDEHYRRLEEINAYCAKRMLPLTVLSGAEILFTDSSIHFLQGRRVPTLNNSRYVLMEWQESIRGDALLASIRDLANAGYFPIIAHAERYCCLVSDIRLIETLRSMFEVRLQVNCASVLTRRRHAAKGAPARWLREGLVDYVATDAHNASTRPVNMAACYEALMKTYGEGYADALSHDNQLEIVGPDYG
ncbi:MAG TPA: hypothetical protein P5559_12650 [Candidatus Limiplasma sp.]|nr:hypothetical protein [Candidatus Limiplasma sp.]